MYTFMCDSINMKVYMFELFVWTREERLEDGGWALDGGSESIKDRQFREGAIQKSYNF